MAGGRALHARWALLCLVGLMTSGGAGCREEVLGRGPRLVEDPDLGVLCVVGGQQVDVTVVDGVVELEDGTPLCGPDPNRTLCKCWIGRGRCHAEVYTACVEGRMFCGADTLVQPGEPEEEVPCNQADDDCDNLIDECYAGPADTLEVGRCRAGRSRCGEVGPPLCTGAILPRPEQCNREDDDCDGETDECYGGPDGTEGIGVCVAGVMSCDDGALGECVGEVTPQGEECNGLDDDCDGRVDEGVEQACYEGPNGTLGIGICTVGIQRCVDGTFDGQPCEGDVRPAAEVCDGRDNDCDDEVDEAVSASCYGGRPLNTGGVGLCVIGRQRCVDGVFGQCEGEVRPAEEVCDGLDNDCDGLVDIADGRAVCGEWVAQRCRVWLGWTDLDGALQPGDDMGRSFTEWAGCPTDPGGADQADQDGHIRCVSSGRDGRFHTLALPLGGAVDPVDRPSLLDGEDRLGILWQCPASVEDDPSTRAMRQMIEEHCRVTLGERHGVQGPDTACEWAPCDAELGNEFGVSGASRCTSTVRNPVQGPRWRALSFGRIFGQGTELGIALRCDAEAAPYLASVERQTALWLGWAARPADGGDPWGDCEGAPVERPGLLHCGAPTTGDAFRTIRVGVDLAQVEDYDPGLLGVALRARSGGAVMDGACAPDEAP